MPLSEKEKKELERLDNPQIEFTGQTGSIFGFFMGGNMSNVNSRKERVVELRTKLRMEQEGLDENDNFKEYYKIKEEEEKRFDERFKK